MRRSPICLCVFVGALVTAVALLRLGELLTTAPTVDHTDRDGAANAALRGGPPTDLEPLLAAACWPPATRSWSTRGPAPRCATPAPPRWSSWS